MNPFLAEFLAQWCSSCWATGGGQCCVASDERSQRRLDHYHRGLGVRSILRRGYCQRGQWRASQPGSDFISMGCRPIESRQSAAVYGVPIQRRDVGGILVYQFYKDHFLVCDSPDAQLACFATGPAIRNPMRSLFCEAVGTFVLVFVLLMFEKPMIDQVAKFGLGAIGLVPVALLILGIGVSLGGTTGYAINPARDLGPRIVHQLLMLPGKRDSDWGYAWIPVVGPVLGGVLAALLYRVVAQVQ